MAEDTCKSLTSAGNWTSNRHLRHHEWRMDMVPKNTICLWYDGTALDAAKFYAETFPDSAVGAVCRAPDDYPTGELGDILTVEFTVMGIPGRGRGGGPAGGRGGAGAGRGATGGRAE